MKVLLTGATGYLGGRLAAYLRERPELDLRLLVPRVPPGLAGWLQGLDVRAGDLTRPETLTGVSDGIDTVVHLAAMNEVECARDPIGAVRANVEGTLHLMRALAPTVRRVIYLSTFHVYGANARGRVTEATPLAPVHPYGATKAMAEVVVTAHARQHGLGAVVLRASNGFGAPLHPDVDRWTLVVNDLCRQAVTTGRIVVRTGVQLRDFVALTDIAEAVRLVLASSLEGVEVFNVGGGHATTILEVARQVQAACRERWGREPLLEPTPGPPASPLEFCIDRLSALGYAPKTTLEEGIRETLRFCQALVDPAEGSP